MDIGKSISYAFEDEDWLRKLGIGAVITAVPVLNIAWTGYLVDVIRNVANNDPRPLPTWDDLGDKLIRGLIISLAVLVYSLPALAAGCLAFTAMLIPAFFAESQAAEEVAIASGGVLLVVGCCILAYILLLYAFVPTVYINYARKGTFAACFQIKELIQIITTNPSDYLVACLAWIGVSLAVGFAVSIVMGVLGWIPCLGWLAIMAASALAAAWGGSVFAHLFGQIAGRESAVEVENVG